MKNLFVYVFLFVSFFAKTQESSSIIIMPRIMKEKEVVLVIKEKNNLGINEYIDRSKQLKNFRSVGFVAIPACLLGAFNLVKSYDHTGYENPSRVKQHNLGVGFLALGAVCLSSSLYFTIEYKKNYKKATQKYNHLYN